MAQWDLGYLDLWEHPPQVTCLCQYQLHSFWLLKLFSSILFFAQVCPKAQKGKWKCPGVKHRNQVLFRWKLLRENVLPLSRETRGSLAYFAVFTKNLLLDLLFNRSVECSISSDWFSSRIALHILILVSFLSFFFFSLWIIYPVFHQGSLIFSSSPFLIFKISLGVSVIHPCSLIEGVTEKIHSWHF